MAELVRKHGITVLTPTSPGWMDTKAAYLIDNPARPVAIARPKSAEEVSILVNAARSHGLKISVRVGGHDVAGRSIADGCLVVDLREIKAIKISEDKKTARIGGGVLIGDVVKTLTPQKLVTPFGYFPTIGYAGWAMVSTPILRKAIPLLK